MPPADQWEQSKAFKDRLRALVVMILSAPESQMG
jgi:hypothetical protein